MKAAFDFQLAEGLENFGCACALNYTIMDGKKKNCCKKYKKKGKHCGGCPKK
jgi:hypothetical protein